MTQQFLVLNSYLEAMLYKSAVIKIQEQMHEEMRKNNKQKCSAL